MSFPDGKTTWLRFRSIAEAAATMQKVGDNVYMPHATYVPQPSAGRVGELRGRRHNLTIAVPVHLLLLRGWRCWTSVAPIAQNIGQKLINRYPVGGTRSPGAPIARRIDQTLTQDATGTLAMLSLEHSTGGKPRSAFNMSTITFCKSTI